MIIKPVYESMPWLYLFIGAAAVLWVESPVAYTAGLVLFGLASLILIMRSNYRRRDDPNKVPDKKMILLPEVVYEMLPYVYLIAGVIILAEFNSWLAIAAVLVTCYRGAQLLYLRHRHRSYAWSNVPKTGQTK